MSSFAVVILTKPKVLKPSGSDREALSEGHNEHKSTRLEIGKSVNLLLFFLIAAGEGEKLLFLCRILLSLAGRHVVLKVGEFGRPIGYENGYF